MEAFGVLLYGFGVLLTWNTLALMMVGLLLGIFVGVLPGLGGPNGVAILLPLTPVLVTGSCWLGVGSACVVGAPPRGSWRCAEQGWSRQPGVPPESGIFGNVSGT